MSRRDLIDPECRIPLDQLQEALPGGFNAIPDINQRREAVTQMLAAMPVPDFPNVEKEDRTIPGPSGQPDLMVRIYRPRNAGSSLPGIYYIHGGGMIMGSVDQEDPNASMICDEVGAVVVSIEYRLAPENPHPAPLDDCYAGLIWMAKNSSELGFDADRLALYGASAGGGLVIATALKARDQGAPSLSFMMPIYPMIDDRDQTPSSSEITDIGIWDRAGNIEAWNWYLGGTEADAYSAPSRAKDLSGLPPAFLDVGTVDLFRDEDIAFAQRLMQAGVPTELHIHPGAYHAAETFAIDSALGQRIWALRLDALKRALGT